MRAQQLEKLQMKVQHVQAQQAQAAGAATGIRAAASNAQGISAGTAARWGAASIGAGSRHCCRARFYRRRCGKYRSGRRRAQGQ